MNRLVKDERGIAVIWVGLSMSVIIGAAVFAIDLSIIQVTRTQLQNAADAAVLAAATDLVPDWRTVAERKTAATADAIAFAATNRAFVGTTVGPVIIDDSDVAFPTDARVTVTTHRTKATGDPVRTYFIRLLPPYNNNGLADVVADASAEVFPASGTKDFYPWTVPDRFQDKDGDGKWDDPESFTDTNENGVWDPGEEWDDVDGDGVCDEGDWYDPLLTGYGTEPPSEFRDAGLLLALKVGDSADAQHAGFFFPARWPPVDYYTGESPGSGGSVYRDWIVNKAPYWARIGDVLHLEFGKMDGPTQHGVRDILDACPTSSFDMTTGQVINHSHPVTEDCPRIGAIAFYDPSDARVSSDKLITIVKISHWFVENINLPKDTVYGRLIQIADPEAIPGGEFSGGFTYTTRLVE